MAQCNLNSNATHSHCKARTLKRQTMLPSKKEKLCRLFISEGCPPARHEFYLAKTFTRLQRWLNGTHLLLRHLAPPWSQLNLSSSNPFHLLDTSGPLKLNQLCHRLQVLYPICSSPASQTLGAQFCRQSRLVPAEEQVNPRAFFSFFNSHRSSRTFCKENFRPTAAVWLGRFICPILTEPPAQPIFFF